MPYKNQDISLYLIGMLGINRSEKAKSIIRRVSGKEFSAMLHLKCSRNLPNFLSKFPDAPIAKDGLYLLSDAQKFIERHKLLGFSQYHANQFLYKKR